jgi:beta-alanine degradation protein BauB
MGDGQSLLALPMPPNTLHSDINAGDKPMEVMVVELEKEK